MELPCGANGGGVRRGCALEKEAGKEMARWRSDFDPTARMGERGGERAGALDSHPTAEIVGAGASGKAGRLGWSRPKTGRGAVRRSGPDKLSAQKAFRNFNCFDKLNKSNN